VETDQLAQLIDAKHGVLTQLRELARRQHALAQVGEPAELISLLAVKQRLLDGLSELERQLTPFRQQDPQARQWRTPAGRARCAAVSTQCRELLAEVLEWERRAMELMQSRQQDTLATIQSASDAAHARGAYLAATATAQQTFDLAAD
jgi:hypothetical protein